MFTMQDMYKLVSDSSSYRLKVPKFPVVIWNFSDAPQSLKDLSQNGGDEDYLLLIPRFELDFLPSWLETICADGDFYDYDLLGFPDFIVRITHHG